MDKCIKLQISDNASKTLIATLKLTINDNLHYKTMNFYL